MMTVRVIEWGRMSPTQIMGHIQDRQEEIREALIALGDVARELERQQVKAKPPMLTDEQIEAIAKPFIQWIGGQWECGEGIAEVDIEDFARAIEQAVLKEAAADRKAHLKLLNDHMASMEQGRREYHVDSD